MFNLPVRQVFAASVVASALFGAAPAFAQAVAIYDSTGGAENGGDSFKTGGPIMVDEVVTSTAGHLTSVVLNLKANKLDASTFEVVLTTVAPNGKPHMRQIINTIADSALTKTFALVTVTPSAPIALAAQTHYYVGIHKKHASNSYVVFGNTIDPNVLNRASVIAGGFYYNNGGVQPNSGGPYELQVNESP